MSSFSLSRYVKEVGLWSQANFGDQAYAGDGDKPCMHLYEAAPLLGVMEEVGEMFDAFGGDVEGGVDISESDLVDSIGDVGIYLCDFLYRDGATTFPDPLPTGERETMASIVGKLCRTYLKHHQGIRDLKSREVYVRERDKCIAKLRYALNLTAIWNTQETFVSCVAKTWESVVAKRDWVADPAAGGGHSHEG